MSFKDKIIEVFEGKVVRKDLTFKVKGNAVVPTYVLEYLLGQNCATDDEELINAGIDKTKETIQNHFVHRSDAEKVKHAIKVTGKHKIIDKIVVSLNERKNYYEATFANLGVSGVRVADAIVNDHQKLLSGGGVWCILTMGFDNAEDAQVRFTIDSIKPIQISGVDLNEYCEKRSKFSTDEWIELLMQSIGLNPEHFNRRDRFIQLSRLIPHVENNYNFIELGPKGTGKSHVFSELSPHGVLVSGGDVSKARLFVSNNGDKIGLVGYWDVVALDEFEQEVGTKRVDGDLVKIMQNYMANKSFNRGKDTYPATASLAFVGNTKRSVPYMIRHSHLFESIPVGYIKGAFLDRIHLYIPGWEVNILKESTFTKDFGFIVDYLAEILRQFRSYDFSNLLDSHIDLDPSLTQRDKIAIKKTFSGLVKIIYPDQRFTDDEFYELLDFAVEGRKRVKDQLYIIDETFKSSPVDFKYTIKQSGKVVAIETLERLNYGTNESLLKMSDEDEITEQNPDEVATSRKVEMVHLEQKEVILRDNQTGISYQKLFAPYLKNVTSITLHDPYLRTNHQFKNFQDFCVMLIKNKNPDDELSLHIVTSYNEGYKDESDEFFNDMTSSLVESGIKLTTEYNNNIHDRFIETNHGWKIKLGRGLDIFVKPENKYDIAHVLQEKRKCRACEITYVNF